MSHGTVIFVSRNGAMLVVQHDQGFTVAELLGGEGEIERGDRVRGDWTSLGGEDLFKDGQAYSAFFQDCYGFADAAVSAVRRMSGG